MSLLRHIGAGRTQPEESGDLLTNASPMADVALASPRAQPVIGRRRTLPNGRAVIGGLLVTASAMGMFLAWSSAAAGPSTRYVVAAKDLAPGTRITAGDVRLVAMDLPAGLATSGAFAESERLFGTVVVGPIRAGELVQSGALTTSAAASEELEISFAIEASRAVGGTLRAGEQVDVLATFGVGGETYTTTVVAGARVLRTAGDDTQTVALALASADAARAVTHAINAGEVVLVRAAPGAANGEARSGTYRAPASTDETNE